MTQDDTDQIEGRKLLADLLPKARETADLIIGMGHVAQLSEVADGMMSVIAERNLDWIRIHREPGGWVGDVRLKDMPPGYPDTIGTPSDSPLPTRDDAIRGAMMAMAMVIAVGRTKTDAPKSDRGFDFFGLHLTIPGNVFESALALIGNDPRPPDQIRDRLDEVKAVYLPDCRTVTGNAFSALTDFDKDRIMSAIVCALARGIYRHPMQAGDEQDPTPTIH